MICAGGSASNWLLSALKEESFGREELRGVFRRIRTIARNKSEIASWEDLCHDPALPESTRSALEVYTKKVKPTTEAARSTFDALESYRKGRVLYNIAKAIDVEINKDSVSIDKAIDDVTEAMASLRGTGEKMEKYRVGTKNNTNKLVDEILKGKTLVALPTGFQAFDARNRGFYLGSLVIVGGTTGGGKTALALQMQSNFADNGAKTALVSLEMTGSEVLARNLARYSGVDIQTVLDPNKTPNDVKKIKGAYVKRVRELAAKGGLEEIDVPTEDVGIEEVLFGLRPFGYNVIIIDYITLLKDADSDDQWKKLGQVARFAKIFAKNNNCIVVLLAQVTQDGMLRYSRTVQEHANNFWMFTRDQRSKDTNIVTIQQKKARNQADFPFDLYFNLPKMQVTDVPEDMKQIADAYAEERKNSGGGGHEAPRPRKDVSYSNGKGNGEQRHGGSGKRYNPRKGSGSGATKTLDEESYFGNLGE